MLSGAEPKRGERMPRLQHPSGGRQPFSPPPTDIARSRTLLALNEAEQGQARMRNRRLLDESQRLKAAFEEIKAVVRKAEANAEERRKLGRRVAQNIEKVLKFYSKPEVQQTLPAESGRVIKVARDLRAHVDGAHSSPAPFDAMLVSLAFAAALLKRKLAPGHGRAS
jgi:hypothetical protein